MTIRDYLAGRNEALAAFKVRACAIECIAHPEWGTFGIMEDHGGHFDIFGRGGWRILDKAEAVKFWRVKEGGAK